MAEPASIYLSEAGAANLARLRSDFGNERAFFGFVLNSFQKSSLIIASRVIAESLSGGSGLRRRTGTLARSTIGHADIINGLPGIRLGIFRGPALAYAAVQELGTVGKGGELPTIRPVRGKYLAVPTDDGGALTPAGVAKYTSARNYPGQLKFARGRFSVMLNRKKITVGAALVDKAKYDRAKAKTASQNAKFDRQERQRGRKAQGQNVRVAVKTRVDRTDINEQLSKLGVVYALLRRADIAPRHFLRDGMNRHIDVAVQTLEDDLERALNGGGLQA